MKLRRRQDRYGPFDRLLLIEMKDGKEFDITLWFYILIVLIISILIWT